MTSGLLQNNPEGKLGAAILSVRSGTFIEQGDFEKALGLAEKTIKKQEYLLDAYLVRARAYSLQGVHKPENVSGSEGLPKSAMEAFNYIEEGSLTFTDKRDKVYFYLYRDIEYCVMGEYKEALADFGKAHIESLKRKPARIEGLLYRGIAYINFYKGDNADEYRKAAIRNFNAALDIKPNRYKATLYSNRGEANTPPCCRTSTRKTT